MVKESVLQEIKLKAKELGISEEFILCALNILYRNKNLVNAMDNQNEMDDYIYRAIIKQSIEKRKHRAEIDLNHNDPQIRIQAEKDLSLLSREELVTDPYFRAVLPLLVKVVGTDPILRLHASEATIIVLELADFKRRHRATSITEVIVKKCSIEIEKLFAESM